MTTRQETQTMMPMKPPAGSTPKDFVNNNNNNNNNDKENTVVASSNNIHHRRQPHNKQKQPPLSSFHQTKTSKISSFSTGDDQDNKDRPIVQVTTYDDPRHRAFRTRLLRARNTKEEDDENMADNSAIDSSMEQSWFLEQVVGVTAAGAKTAFLKELFLEAKNDEP